MVMSREFLDRAARVHAAADPDDATAQTISLMCEQIAKSANDATVQRAASRAINQFRGGPFIAGRLPANDPRAIAASCWWLAKSSIEFVHHDPMILMMWGETGQQQLLISPDVLVRMERPCGDCAVFTSFICACLRTAGVPFEILTAEVDPNRPGEYGHVWARAVMPDGSRVPLDASHGSYPGWQVPREHIIRLQVWDESGQPIADASPWGGLHGYAVRLLKRPRGMGACGTDPSSGEQWCTPDSQPSTAGGFNWGSFAANLANQWTQIGSRVIAPTTEYRSIGPQGQTIITTPGSAPIGGGTLLGGAGTTGGGLSTLALVGIGLVALLVFPKGK